MTSKIVVNNIETDAGISSVTLLSHVAGHDSTQNISGINSVTANSFHGTVHGSGANLTNLPAGNLTGTLPALDGSALTGVGASFGNSSVNTTGIITATAVVSSQGALSNRNITVNGGMMVSQRATSASFTSGASFPAVDRFKLVANSGMTVNTTISQTADNPDGLGYCLKVLANAAKTPSGSENLIVRYAAEEQDIKKFGYGTSSCKEVTISFSVKSNKTGTYSLQIYLGNYIPNIITTYTINSANTWEFKSITLPTYTTSFSHNADNAMGMLMDWHLSDGPDDIVGTTGWQTAAGNARAATGQVNLLDTISNYWQLTNVQVETGSVATPFEHRSFGEELQRCQRYCYADRGSEDYHAVAQGHFNGTGTGITMLYTPVNMRAAPTLSYPVGTWIVSGDSGTINPSNIYPTDNIGEVNAFQIRTAHSGGQSGEGFLLRTSSAGHTWILDSEVVS